VLPRNIEDLVASVHAPFEERMVAQRFDVLLEKLLTCRENAILAERDALLP
jgi:hypothetical protein